MSESTNTIPEGAVKATIHVIVDSNGQTTVLPTDLEFELGDYGLAEQQKALERKVFEAKKRLSDATTEEAKAAASEGVAKAEAALALMPEFKEIHEEQRRFAIELRQDAKEKVYHLTPVPYSEYIKAESGRKTIVGGEDQIDPTPVSNLLFPKHVLDENGAPATDIPVKEALKLLTIFSGEVYPNDNRMGFLSWRRAR